MGSRLGSGGNLKAVQSPGELTPNQPATATATEITPCNRLLTPRGLRYWPGKPVFDPNEEQQRTNVQRSEFYKTALTP